MWNRQTEKDRETEDGLKKNRKTCDTDRDRERHATQRTKRKITSKSN